MSQHEAWEIRSFMLPYAPDEQRERLRVLSAEGFVLVGQIATTDSGVVGFFQRRWLQDDLPVTPPA